MITNGIPYRHGIQPKAESGRARQWRTAADASILSNIGQGSGAAETAAHAKARKSEGAAPA